MKKICLLVCSIIALQGCSATMALPGDKESNLSVIQKEQNKAIVESQPLKPLNTEVLKNGNIISLYQYTMGNSPSAGRAAVYVLLDATTCFISEIVTMPIEMSKTSEVKIIRIEYTPQGEIIKIG